MVQWIGGRLASPDKEAILVCWVLHVQLHSTAGCSDPCMHLVIRQGAHDDYYTYTYKAAGMATLSLVLRVRRSPTGPGWPLHANASRTKLPGRIHGGSTEDPRRQRRVDALGHQLPTFTTQP